MSAGGRPPMFDNPEDMEDAIQQYFSHCTPKIESGELKSLGENITITGLALYLGFESRQSFYDYEKREEFSYVIKRARLKVESEYEKQLYSKNPTGSIFALKNMGWTDKQEVVQHSTLRDERYDYSKLTPEQRNLLADLQLQLRGGEGE